MARTYRQLLPKAFFRRPRTFNVNRSLPSAADELKEAGFSPRNRDRKAYPTTRDDINISAYYEVYRP